MDVEHLDSISVTPGRGLLQYIAHITLIFFVGYWIDSTACTLRTVAQNIHLHFAPHRLL